MTLLPWNHYIHQKVLIFYSLFLPAKYAAFSTKLKIYLIIYMFRFFQYVLSKWHTFSVNKFYFSTKQKTEWNEWLQNGVQYGNLCGCSTITSRQRLEIPISKELQNIKFEPRKQILKLSTWSNNINLAKNIGIM